jgi:DNA-binding transcriptional MocR family regulator
LIRDLLTQLVEDADATELLGYPLFRADGRYATAASMWIARTTTMPLLPPREVIPCQGATQGMLAIMDYLFQRGDRIACEQVTYGGFKVVARLLGLKLHPIGQDSEGLCPDSLEKACRDNQVRGLLICPTHQNPTGATTSLRRREELLAIARRYDLRIVEDDVYGPLAGKDASPPAFAVLDRARTFYVASASKSLAPGLRAGWVGFLAFAKMCETRMADEVLASVKRETAIRRDMALQILGPHVQIPLEATSLHLWIPAAANMAEAIYSRLVRQDIHPTPPDAPMVNCAPTGLRLCLGGPERSQDLESALHTVRALLEISGELITSSVP